MRYSKFELNIFILLLARIEFEKKILYFYFFKFKIIHFIHLLNKKKINKS